MKTTIKIYYMKFYYFLFGIFLASVSYGKGVRTTPEQYITLYKGAAIEEMIKSGIPASITLAQGMLESAFGNSRLAKKAKNHFGIKCHSDWSGPSVKKDDDAKNECFRKYKNVWESYRDHSKFLTGKSRYAFLFEYKTTDYKSWAKGLKKAGYATNPKYPRLLIDLIERYELHQYDRGGGSKKGKKDQHIKSQKGKKGRDDEDVVHIGSRVRVSDNYVKYVIVEKGEDLKSIEKKTGVRMRRILKYNERSKRRVHCGEILYIQPKKRSSKTKYHKVRRGETLYEISQKFAVTMKSIKKRNRLGKEDTIYPGQKLKLRGRKIKL